MTALRTAPGAAKLLRGYTIEVAAKGRKVAEICRAHLTQGTEVYIASPPGHAPYDLVDTAIQLHRAGFIAVPHITARNVLSYTQIGETLARLHGDAAVTRALVIGGDAPRPLGPYESSLELLRLGVFQKHGIGRIGVACYPEAHHQISAAQMAEALAAKLALLGEIGIEPWLVSQFAFEAQPIVTCAERLRAAGVAAPLRVGLAGPANRRTLWKFALHCGIGNSIRALGTRVDAVAQLMVRDAPDAIVEEIAATAEQRPELGIDGIHLFTFGGVAQSAAWANGRLARR